MNQINPNGEVPQIEFKAPKGFKLPVPENNSQQAYMAMLAVRKAQEKAEKQKENKHIAINALINLGCTLIGFILGKLC